MNILAQEIGLNKFLSSDKIYNKVAFQVLTALQNDVKVKIIFMATSQNKDTFKLAR